jgi:hypothetical protein
MVQAIRQVLLAVLRNPSGFSEISEKNNFNDLVKIGEAAQLPYEAAEKTKEGGKPIAGKMVAIPAQPVETKKPPELIKLALQTPEEPGEIMPKEQYSKLFLEIAARPVLTRQEQSDFSNKLQPQPTASPLFHNEMKRLQESMDTFVSSSQKFSYLFANRVDKQKLISDIEHISSHVTDKIAEEKAKAKQLEVSILELARTPA